MPYALEEQLAEDIDELHFAIGKRDGDSPTTPVAVVALALMDEWTNTLKAAGLVPESMYVDSDLLPVNPGHAVALLEDDVVVVRPRVGATISMPSDALAEALQLVSQSGGTESGGEGTGRGLILYTGAAEWQQFSPQVEAVRDQFDGIKVQLLTGGPLAAVRSAAAYGEAHQSAPGAIHAADHSRGWLAGVASRGDAARRPRRASCRRQGASSSC